VANPGRARTAKEHAFAQALDLARREAGLSTSGLAARLYCAPRSVRRYLSAERRPSRDIVKAWEVVCGVDAERLVKLYDGLDAGEPAASSAAPTETAGPGRRRRGILAGVAGALVLGGLALAVLLGHENDGGSPVARTTLAPTSWDHQDPLESGCAKTAELLASAPVMHGGRRAGTLELRGSTACQTGWGRVVLRVQHAPPFVVEVVRPSDGATDRFVYSKRGRVIFGNMLKHDKGCVYASVRVGPVATGLLARTACRR